MRFCLSIAGSFDAWLAGKSSYFRGQMRRLRRQFANAGGQVRATTAATLHDDVETLMRLHSERWEGRGASAIVAKAAGFRALFEQLGTTELEGGRLRLYVLVPLAAGNKPPGFAWCVRALHQAARWNMVEVFTVGVLLSLVRLAGLADTAPEPGLFALGAMTALFAAIESAGLKHLWWHVQ